MFKTLRATLLFGFLSFTIITLLVGVISGISMERRNRISDVVLEIGSLHTDILENINTVFSFLQFESVNPVFYETGESKYLNIHKEQLHEINQKLVAILKEKDAMFFELDTCFLNILDELQVYTSYVSQIATLQREKGFEDFGVTGEMRRYAHYLERQSVVPSYELLMLRRHEKDYQLRNKKKYVELFRKKANELNWKIMKLNENKEYKDSLLYNLNLYSSLFEKEVFLNEKLGIKNNTGLSAELQKSCLSIENLIIKLHTDAKKKENQIIYNYNIFLMVSIIIILLLSVYFSFVISEKMTHRITALATNIKSFIESDFQNIDEISVSTGKDDEVSNLVFYYKFMQQEIRELVFDFKRKVDERTEEIQVQKERIEDQSLEIKNQRDELFIQNKYIEEQNHLLETRNKEIEQSISYAAGLQRALMPSGQQVEAIFPEHFILNVPLDVISGDFYWINQICVQGIKYKIFAVADCTGHGIPGGLVSMLGISLLNEIILRKKIFEPKEILKHLRENMLNSMIRFVEKDKPYDGMDIAIAVIDTQSNKLIFSGANRDLYFIRNSCLSVCHGEKIHIGKSVRDDIQFTQIELDIVDGDTFYMSTDGYTDQFGGVDNKKFTKKRLRDYIVDIHASEMNLQAEKLLSNMYYWKGDNSQVDDILIIGVKYNA